MSTIDAEIELIKCIIFDYNSCEKAFSIVKPEYFSSKKYREIFETSLKLLNNGKEVNAINLCQELEIYAESIIDLSSLAFTASNVNSYAEVIVKSYFKGVAFKKLIEVANSSKDLSLSIDGLREKVEEIAYFLSCQSEYKGLRPIKDFVNETVAEMDSTVNKGDLGISTGFKDLDRLGFRLRPGNLIVIGARPRMGKSALVLDIAERCGAKVAFFSLEMAGKEQIERMISKRSGLTNNELRSKKTILESKNEILKHAAEITKYPIWINDSPCITPIQIKMQCKRLQAKSGLGLVIVDYMGYIKSGTKERFENRRVEIGNFSRGLKELSKELNVPVIVLSQLNRECESRTNKRPMLADLRETGDIEQDANIVLFVHREAVYGTEGINPELAELIIAKNRAGQEGTVKTLFKKEITSFVDYNISTDFDRENW